MRQRPGGSRVRQAARAVETEGEAAGRGHEGRQLGVHEREREHHRAGWQRQCAGIRPGGRRAVQVARKADHAEARRVVQALGAVEEVIVSRASIDVVVMIIPFAKMPNNSLVRARARVHWDPRRSSRRRPSEQRERQVGLVHVERLERVLDHPVPRAPLRLVRVRARLKPKLVQPVVGHPERGRERPVPLQRLRPVRLGQAVLVLRRVRRDPQLHVVEEHRLAVDVRPFPFPGAHDGALATHAESRRHELVEVLREDLSGSLVGGAEIPRRRELGGGRGRDGHEHVLLHRRRVTEEHVVARSLDLDPILRPEELVPVDGVVERAVPRRRASERARGGY
mmetsp:Transcript_10065/g.43806  ORF Transcript_10065/g.43806 Transcript_10065/m.43806 type:complete len:338 (+) Transcript_10065:850-1863(+)